MINRFGALEKIDKFNNYILNIINKFESLKYNKKIFILWKLSSNILFT